MLTVLVLCQIDYEPIMRCLNFTQLPRATFGSCIYFKGRWAHWLWSRTWHKTGLLSKITLLELFPVIVSIIMWGSELSNKKVLFQIDNEGVVHIRIKKSSKSLDVMILVRSLVLETLHNNLCLLKQNTDNIWIRVSSLLPF